MSAIRQVPVGSRLLIESEYFVENLVKGRISVERLPSGGYLLNLRGLNPIATIGVSNTLAQRMYTSYETAQEGLEDLLQYQTWQSRHPKYPASAEIVISQLEVNSLCKQSRTPINHLFDKAPLVKPDFVVKTKNNTSLVTRKNNDGSTTTSWVANSATRNVTLSR